MFQPRCRSHCSRVAVLLLWQLQQCERRCLCTIVGCSSTVKGVPMKHQPVHTNGCIIIKLTMSEDSCCSLYINCHQLHGVVKCLLSMQIYRVSFGYLSTSCANAVL